MTRIGWLVLAGLFAGPALAQSVTDVAPSTEALAEAEAACAKEVQPACLLTLARREIQRSSSPSPERFLREILYAQLVTGDQAGAERVLELLKGGIYSTSALMEAGHWDAAEERVRLGFTRNITHVQSYYAGLARDLIAGKLARGLTDEAITTALDAQFYNQDTINQIILFLFERRDHARIEALLSKLENTEGVDSYLTSLVPQLAAQGFTSDAAGLAGFVTEPTLRETLLADIATNSAANTLGTTQESLQASYEGAMGLGGFDRLAPLIRVGEAQFAAGFEEDALKTARASGSIAHPKFFPIAPIRGELQERVDELAVPVARTALLFYRLNLPDEAAKLFAVSDALAEEVDRENHMKMRAELALVDALANRSGVGEKLAELYREAIELDRLSIHEQQVSGTLDIIVPRLLHQARRIERIITAPPSSRWHRFADAVVKACEADGQLDQAIAATRTVERFWDRLILIYPLAKALINAGRQGDARMLLTEARDTVDGNVRNVLAPTFLQDKAVSRLAEVAELQLRLGFAEDAQATLQLAYDEALALPTEARPSVLIRIATAFYPDRQPPLSF